MKNHIKIFFVGSICGFANGFFGAGGGLILIPVFERVFHIEERKAHATTTAIILPLCILSSIIFCYKKELDFNLISYISLGGIAGGFIGANLLNKISGKWLNKIFGVFMIAAAIKMIL